MSNSRNNYIKSLLAKGYKIINDSKVSLGSIVFNINEGDRNTAMGVQHTFWLTLSSESDLNLVPNPWK